MSNAGSLDTATRTSIVRRPTLSVCVAVYRDHGAPNVRGLYDALAAAAGDHVAEMVVVANGLDARHLGLPADVTIIALEENHGVAIAWNRAAAAAAGEALCFVNDDVALGPSALSLLFDALRDHPGAAIVGPSASFWDLPAGAHVAYADLRGLPPGTAVECDVVSGFLFAIRRDAFQALGGFDEAYTPSGFEEVDICTAARVAGHRILGVAGVDVAHEFGISTAEPTRTIAFLGHEETVGSIAARNRAHFLEKWTGRFPGTSRRKGVALRPEGRRQRVLGAGRALVKRVVRR